MYVATLSALMVLLGTDAEAAAAVRVPSSQELQQAVADLGAVRFSTRQEATNLLWKTGEAARPYLEQALLSRDGETRLRARKVLDRFDLGIFAETPTEVTWWIERFRVGETRERAEAVRQLSERGAVPEVLRLLKLDTDERLISAARPGLVTHLREKGVAAQMLRWWADASNEQLKQDILRLALEKYQVQGDLNAIESLGLSHPDPELRTATRKWIEASLTNLIWPQAERGAWDRVRTLVELGAVGDQGMRHLAVYELLQGNLDKRIEQLRAQLQAEASPGAAQLRQLVHLLRVRGDWMGAQEVASRLGAEGREFREMILMQAQLWNLALEQATGPAIAASSQPADKVPGERDPAPRETIDRLSLIAAFQKAAGQEDAFQQTVSTIYTRGSKEMLSRSAAAEALLILGETPKGLELKMKDEDLDAFRLLTRQYRYADAFRSAQLGPDRTARDRWFAQTAEDLRTHARGSHERLQTALQVILVLSQVGHHEEVEQALKLLGEVVQNDGFTTRVRSLCETAMQAGRADLAFQHAASSISKDLTMLKVLFPLDERTATTLWEHFRETQGDQSFGASLQQVRDLMTPGNNAPPPPTLDRVLVALKTAGLAATGQERESYLLAAAQLASLWNRHDAAMSYYELIANQSSNAALRLADLHAARQAWEPAAQWYGRVWELDRTRIGALYLKGKMLAQLGQLEEAEKWMRLAKLLPLADAQLRFDGLGKMLSTRKHAAEAIEQWSLTLRHGLSTEKPVLDAASELGRISQRTDPLLATQYWRQILWSCLGRFRFTQTEGYIHMPYLIEKTVIEQQIAAKDYSAVVARARRTLAICPGDGNLVEQLVPILKEAGQPQLADELFNQAYDIIEANCRLFAQSASCRNDLAWLAARCDRRLDEALRYAKQATELAPDRASYLDTLAEVHFRRGELTEAVAVSQRCLTLDPNNRYFQDQAARFRAAHTEP